jgi:hypothetical protein
MALPEAGQMNRGVAYQQDRQPFFVPGVSVSHERQNLTPGTWCVTLLP